LRDARRIDAMEAATIDERARRVRDAISIASAMGAASLITGFALVTIETYAQGVIRGWETATSLAITGVWTAYALATLAAGIYLRSTALRVLALAFILLTTGKVFLYDVWHLEPAIRTVAFTLLGAALLAVSYLYRRYRDRIRAWIAPAPPMAR
jgi:uncharacterized membrane protein